MRIGPETGGAMPVWEPLFRPYEALAASRFLPPQRTLGIGMMIIGNLLRTKALDDLGTLQEHLHRKVSEVQLTAWEFQPRQYPGCVCVDPRTEEPRTHQLIITVGKDTSPFGQELTVLRRDHDRNAVLLRDFTGLVRLDGGGIG